VAFRFCYYKGHGPGRGVSHAWVSVGKGLSRVFVCLFVCLVRHSLLGLFAVIFCTGRPS
jgi:hypothetical protein